MSKLGIFKDIIESQYGTEYSTSGEEMIYNCPYCPEYKEDRKLYINSRTGVYNCFRCGAKGRVRLDKDSQVVISNNNRSLFDLCKSFVNSLDEDIKNSEHQLFVEIPPYRLIDYPNSVFYKYIINRGLSPEDIDYYDLRVFGSEYQFHNRVVFPNKIINRNWTDFFTSRAIFSDMKPKYINSNVVYKSNIVFNIHRIEDNSDIIINEGIINSIIAGQNSVAILGKYCSDEQFRLIMDKHPRSITISLDTDAQEQAYQLANRFVKKGVSQVRIMHLPNNLDASNLGHQQYYEYVNQSEDYSIKGQLITGILNLIGGN